jgi:hypothetical protein
MKKFIVLMASVLGATAMALPAWAQQPAKVGTLTCDISGGIGMIVTSQKTMTCNFAPTKGAKEVYVGSINKFGLDIGATTQGRMVWAVFAPTSRKGRRLSRRLCRRYCRSNGRCRAWRQRAGRRLGSHGQLAAGIGAGTIRIESRGGCVRFAITRGALSFWWGARNNGHLARPLFDAADFGGSHRNH